MYRRFSSALRIFFEYDHCDVVSRRLFDHIEMILSILLWQGMELYPRMWKVFDIKIFLNCRFAIMGWAVLVLSFAIKQVDLPSSP